MLRKENSQEWERPTEQFNSIGLYQQKNQKKKNTAYMHAKQSRAEGHGLGKA